MIDMIPLFLVENKITDAGVRKIQSVMSNRLVSYLPEQFRHRHPY